MTTRASAGRAWTVIAIVLALLTAVVVGWVVLAWSHPYRHPESYLPEVERASRPLIDAIDAHTRRRGTPPSTLADLLPEFDASTVATGYPPQRHFDYHVWRKGVPEDAWGLFLYTELLALNSEAIQYDSRTRTWQVR